MNRWERETCLKYPVTTRVRCGSELHEIRVLGSGKLVLLGHDRLSTEANLAAQALGGKCRCVEILSGWREVNTTKLARQRNPNAQWSTFPKSLHDVRLRGHMRGVSRREKLLVEDRDHLGDNVGRMDRANLSYRLYQYKRARDVEVMDACRDAIVDAGYRSTTQRVIVTAPYVECHADPTLLKNGITASMEHTSLICRVKAYVARDWLRAVHAKGLAVIDGCLVLAVADEVDRIRLALYLPNYPEVADTVVLAAKQNPRGLAITTGWANVVGSGAARKLVFLQALSW